MKKRIVKIMLIVLIIFLAIVIVAVIALLNDKNRTAHLNNDYSAVFSEEKYHDPVNVSGVEVITQDVSCGYAVIEMFSGWCGKNITEKTLYEEYGKVVTSTGKRFCEEMNKQFPEYTTTMHKNLTNTELLDTVYECLKNGIPVPIEWAAPHDGAWTLHYSLVTGMDIPGDKITVANPYGYYEEVSVDEFLSRTRFDAYENMSLFLKLGFAFGIFEKNTVFGVED